MMLGSELAGNKRRECISYFSHRPGTRIRKTMRLILRESNTGFRERFRAGSENVRVGFGSCGDAASIR